MQFSDINPYVRYVRRVSSKGANFALSCNYDSRLFFFAKWKGSIRIGNKEHKISTNDVVFLPPASCYQLICDIDDGEVYVLCVDLDRSHSDKVDGFYSVWVENFDASLVLSCDAPEEFSHPVIANVFELKEKFKRCYDEFRQRTLYFREITSVVVKLIFAEMMRKATLGNSESTITSEVIDYVKKNYSDVNLSNERIAACFDYHPAYLNRVIKTATGKPLHKYIIEYRVESAKNKLVSSKDEITTIAKLCGFASSSYFIKVFKAECGMTPVAFRRKYSMIV